MHGAFNLAPLPLLLVKPGQRVNHILWPLTLTTCICDFIESNLFLVINGQLVYFSVVAWGFLETSHYADCVLHSCHFYQKRRSLAKGGSKANESSAAHDQPLWHPHLAHLKQRLSTKANTISCQSPFDWFYI